MESRVPPRFNIHLGPIPGELATVFPVVDRVYHEFPTVFGAGDVEAQLPSDIPGRCLIELIRINLSLSGLNSKGDSKNMISET